MSEPTSPFLPALEWEQRPQPQVWIIGPPRQRWWLYGLFLLLTLFSTMVVGASGPGGQGVNTLLG